MNYNDAVKIAKANNHLIGKEWKGATIDEIIIVPTDAELRKEYERLYAQTWNAQAAISRFVNNDVDIIIVLNKSYMRTMGVFCFDSIYNLPENFGVKNHL